jgi:hypothetical protein
MAIISSYAVFRALFADAGAPVALDGLAEWSYALVRANGIPEFIGVQQVAPLTLLVTINDGAADAVPGVDEFDFWVSQRTSDPAGFPFEVSRTDPLFGSGSIYLSISAWAEALYPEPFEDRTIPLLWRDVWVYCRRRSDGAIQVMNAMKYVWETLMTPSE